eukprot:1180338-Ditylum_brightwellii.AAC.1
MKKLREAIKNGMKIANCDKEETVNKWQASSSAEKRLTEVKDEGQLARIKDRKKRSYPCL